MSFYTVRDKMPMTPLQRKAAFKAATVLRETTKGRACEDVLECSVTHLDLCLAGVRVPGPDLAQRVADFIGKPVEMVWGNLPTTAAA